MDQFLGRLHNIFDQLDPGTSAALVKPTIEQLAMLIQGKLNKLDFAQSAQAKEVQDLEVKLTQERSKSSELLTELETKMEALNGTIAKLDEDNKSLAR